MVHGAGSKAAADSASSSSRNKKDATSASRSKTSAKVSGLASPSAKGSSGATEDAAGGSGAGAASTPAAAAGKKRKADGTVVKDAVCAVCARLRACVRVRGCAHPRAHVALMYVFTSHACRALYGCRSLRCRTRVCALFSPSP